MFKKFGMVTVGVTAGLLAAAPLASAGEAPHDSGHSHSHGDHDGDHKKKHHGSSDCNVTGGSAEANGGIGGDALLGNALTQAPVGGANIGNIVCNDILNDNLSGNNVSISVLGDDDEDAPVVIDEDDIEGDGETA